MSVSGPRSASAVAHHDAPLIDERAGAAAAISPSASLANRIAPRPWPLVPTRPTGVVALGTIVAILNRLYCGLVPGTRSPSFAASNTRLAPLPVRVRDGLEEYFHFHPSVDRLNARHAKKHNAILRSDRAFARIITHGMIAISQDGPASRNRQELS